MPQMLAVLVLVQNVVAGPETNIAPRATKPTDDDLIKQKGPPLEQPTVWALPEPVPPTIHIAKGLWWEFFGLNAMAAELGGLYTSSYWNGGLRGFPDSAAAYMAQNLIVLADVNAPAMSPQHRVLLRSYVQNGGAVLVLGGRFALESGGYAGTALAELLPCTLGEGPRLKAGTPLILEPGSDSEGVLPANLAWALKPHVYYYHTLKAKPGAMVLARAGERPLLIAGTFGKGRVAVFGISPEGDPPADQLAFWDWSDLPRLMAAVSRWLMAAPRAGGAAVATASEESRQQLAKLGVPNAKDEAKRDKALVELAKECRDASYARGLLEAVSTFDVMPSRRLVEAVAEAVRPYADASLAELAKGLVASDDAGKVALGLRVLGMARSEKAGEVLARAATHGFEGLKGAQSATVGNDGLSGVLEAGGEGERVRLAAVMGLGDLADARYITSAATVTRDFADKRQQPPEVTDATDLDETLYQESLIARVRMGESAAVALLFDAAVKNQDDAEQYKNAMDDMIGAKPSDVLKTHLVRRVGDALPALAARQAAIRRALCAAPYALAGAVVTELARRNDPRLSPFGWVALCPTAQRKLTRETALALLPLVEKARRPEQRLQGYRLVASLNDAQLTRQLTALVVTLASSQDPVDVRFALDRTPELGAPDRATVLKAARAHPDPAIQRLGARFGGVPASANAGE
jgi:uncharacterized membrane protein